MRSVGFGLILVLVAGAAQAAGCLLTRATLQVVDNGERFAEQPVTHPELVGQRFEVQRYTVLKRQRMYAPTGSMREFGYEAVDLRGPTGRQVIRVDHVGGTPAVVTTSWPDDSYYEPTDRTQWTPTKAPKVKVGDEAFYMFGGDLQSLALKVTACR